MYVVQNGVAYRLAGSSGKVVWQDRLTTSSQSGSANLRVVNSMVYVVLDFDIYALDARNGEQIWHVANHTKKAYFWFVVADERLYLFSLDNTFSALNTADGSVVWHNTTFFTEDGYGFTVNDGNLYTVNSDGTELYTLDGATGQVRWHLYLSQFSLLNSPLVANGVVYVAGGNTLYTLKEQNGERIWKQTVPVSGEVAAGYLADGVLFVTNVSDIPQAASQNVDSRNFFAYSAKTGRLLWAAEPGYAFLFDLPITNGLLIVPRQYNGIYSIAGLNPQTGRVVWQVPFQCAVSRFDQQVNPACSAVWTAIINGELYLLESSAQSPDKTVYTLKSVNPGTGQLLSAHEFTLGQDGMGVVGANNGLLYVRIGVPKTANDLPYADFVFAAYRLSDGSLVWSHAMPAFPPPTTANTEPNTSLPVLAP
jgi:outer membrane protein assembly factor BamB